MGADRKAVILHLGVFNFSRKRYRQMKPKVFCYTYVISVDNNFIEFNNFSFGVAMMGEKM